MIKAIFFDFNGVVIDDEPIQLLVYQELLKTEGIVLTEEEYFASLGMSDTVFVRAAFSRAGKQLTDENFQSLIERKIVAHRKKLESGLPIFPGVVTFVKAASRHFSLGIVSMALRTEIEDVLERANIRALFEVIVSAEDVETCKPDPACYLRGLSALNEKRRKESRPEVSSNECLVIEDSPPGIESSRSAGMRSLGVTNTVSEKALRDAGADVVTKSLFDWYVDSVRRVFG
jgi:HAD superfamily hydrolase (TIGR01509 family)